MLRLDCICPGASDTLARDMEEGPGKTGLAQTKCPLPIRGHRLLAIGDRLLGADEPPGKRIRPKAGLTGSSPPPPGIDKAPSITSADSRKAIRHPPPPAQGAALVADACQRIGLRRPREEGQTIGFHAVPKAIHSPPKPPIKSAHSARR